MTALVGGLSDILWVSTSSFNLWSSATVHLRGSRPLDLAEDDNMLKFGGERFWTRRSRLIEERVCYKGVGGRIVSANAGVICTATKARRRAGEKWMIARGCMRASVDV